MKRNGIIPLLGILLILGAAVYWVYTQYLGKSISLIQASGTIEATTVDLTTKSPGTIKMLAFQEGASVQKQDFLAELTRSDLVAQQARDALAVQAAQANLDDLQSGSRVQEIKVAQANCNIAQVNLDQAILDLARADQLYQGGALSQQAWEQAQLNAQLKQNQLDAAKANLELLQAGTRPAKIAAAAAEVERTQAVLQATQSLLDDLKLYSPMSGTVLTRNYEPGEYVAAGVALATIADLDHLWVKIYIPTDDLPSIQLGQQVAFTVSGDSTQYTGTVSHIATKGEFTPKTIQTKQERTNVVYEVKIEIDNVSGALKPGMPADVVFGRS
ncbi:MAG: efflux RND transporter periplasmic adaptor subunit [Syntrophomonadaceae bacterium]